MKRKFSWIVANRFLNSQEKFRQLNQRLLNAAKNRGIDLKVVTNDQLLVRVDQVGLTVPIDLKPDFVVFLDKDIRLAQALEESGLKLFNTARSIEICDDKSLTALMLAGQGIKTPITILGPKTFDGVGYSNLDFLNEVVKQLGFPLVVKECFGSFGKQVYMVNTMDELEKIVSQTSKPILFQEFIASSFGRDIRINVVGGEVVTAMQRINKNNFRANVTNGASMLPYEPTNAECEMAVRACEIVGADFAGVDLLFGKDEPILCEINSNAHIENIYNCTGVDVSEKMLGHILKII